MVPRHLVGDRAYRPRFATLLAASAVGVYLLVVAGATASIADAARACGTWPACRGPLAATPALLIAWGHRLLAATVGVLVVAAAVAGLRSAADRRIGAMLAAVVVLYPVQIGLGAVVATSGGASPFPGAHLATGTTIFVVLVAALAWQLEAETGDASGAESERASPAVAAPDRNDAPSPDAGDADRDPSDPAASTDPAAPSDTGPASDPAAASAPVDLPLRRRLVATAFAYFRLTKPRLMWLLCLVAGAGMALADGPGLTIRTVVLTLGGGVLAIGAAGTFNHVFERDVDRRMDRTADRPVATHQLPVRNAVAFGLALTAASLALFWRVNALVAALGLTAILFYSVVYTLVLKPNTVQNTVIGGFAGSLPALIGWVAVTGADGPYLPGVLLATLIFLWTPAHFYNLAMAYREDYARGGFPMMPVVRGETETRKHVLWYLGATLVAAGALIAVADLGPLTAGATGLLGAAFLWAVVRLHRERTDRAAFRAFHASNAYLGTVLVAIVIDALAL